MILERFYDQKLAQASYLVGCAATGNALVVDPNRDVQPYLDTAAREGLRITHVTETHIHADFVSGTRELAARTGATEYLSAEGGADWQYPFAAEDRAVLLRDGATFPVGNIRIGVLHTPGHTPEHLSFLVTDTAGADRPIGALTGDFVFVGDVGRPDLLEKAARVTGSMDQAARTLFRSLQRFRREQPDWLQIWPGHGAGSACGKGLSAIPHSTVGYERHFNWAFSHDEEDPFVAAVLAGQPEPPAYFAEMKRINREGPPVLGRFPAPARLPDARLEAVLADGAVVVDTRLAPLYARRYVPGTINIPLDRSFTTWAGWLVPYDRPFYLIVDEAGRKEEVRARVAEAVRDLTMIGLERVAGIFGASAVEGWADGVRTLASIPRVRAQDVEDALRTGGASVLDVRGQAEWDAGHIPGVPNIPVGLLRGRAGELRPDRPVIVHCKSGARAAIAASVLTAAGFSDVRNYAGSFSEWESTGRPVEQKARSAPHLRQADPAAT